MLILLKMSSAIGQDSLYYFTPAVTKIDVKINEAFTVKLTAGPSCGFHWTLDQSDTINVKLISVTHQNASGRIQQKGGDVYEFWKFIGLHAGKYNLEFVERGPAREHKEISRCKFELWIH
jgi:predicted secreted protein